MNETEEFRMFFAHFWLSRAIFSPCYGREKSEAERMWDDLKGIWRWSCVEVNRR
jgi:hypothetical protein